MKARSQRIAIASAVAISLFGPAALAGGAASDGYFEAQRALTDGQVAVATLPTESRQAPAPARDVSAADREFLFRLSRTDGSAEPGTDGAMARKHASASESAVAGVVIR